MIETKRAVSALPAWSTSDTWSVATGRGITTVTVGSTGLRIGEAFDGQVGDLEFDNGRVDVRRIWSAVIASATKHS